MAMAVGGAGAERDEVSFVEFKIGTAEGIDRSEKSEMEVQLPMG